MSIKNILLEQKRMPYDKFLRKVKEYFNRRNIDMNANVTHQDLRQAYKDGRYPSKFAREMCKRRKKK